MNDNGNLYDDIRQATANIEQLSLLGRQLDMPVIVKIFIAPSIDYSNSSGAYCVHSCTQC